MRINFKNYFYYMLVAICMFFTTISNATTSSVVFEDDFELGLNKWDSSWGPSWLFPHTGTYSVESGPDKQGKHTMAEGIDTINADEIIIHFWMQQYQQDEGSIFLNYYVDDVKVNSIDMLDEQYVWKEYNITVTDD